MKRTLIALTVAVAMLSMTFPAQVSAHESTATDLNDVAYDEVWPLLGPGGATDNEVLNDALETVGLRAEPLGGEPVAGTCTHHADGQIEEAATANTCPDSDVETVKSYQCTGARASSPTEPADLQFHSNKTYLHSDLENGIFEATGSFFVPVEFSGEAADEVDQVWFGFLTTFAWPLSSALCQDPFPLPGAYYEFYRGDTEPNDQGTFEIPVNTLLVPDAPYGAVLRALDSNGNTLAVTFVYSNVNNYLNDANWQPGTPSTCDQSGDTGTALCPYHDTTPPRGMVYNAPRSDDQHSPRDPPKQGTENGVPDNCDVGVSVEYGEPLADWEVTGASGAFEFDAPDRDVDSVPIETTATDHWGPGICVTSLGSDGAFTIKAWDQTGNVGTQTIDTT